jgi:catechol 2,3-dioxygenase-like lactoylglutathione lyase family enzyme
MPLVFDHVGIRCSDRAASDRFYATVLGVLGRAPQRSELYTEWDDFAIGPVDAEHPLTRRLHVGFTAASRAQVDAFWRAGVDAGHRSDGEPGLRPQYAPDYYGAYLLDPDGNSVEAVHHADVNESGVIDHVALRVLDVPSAQAFYATIADAAHLHLGEHDAQYASFRISSGGALSLHAGNPSEAVHIAFPGTRTDVHAFHATATAAGYRDNGAPGERPIYHPGYYAAFVLDPDGHNVEVVSHRDPEAAGEAPAGR